MAVYAEVKRSSVEQDVEFEVIDSDGHISETGEDVYPYLEAPYTNSPHLRRRMAAFTPSLDGWNRLATSLERTAARGRLANPIVNVRDPNWLDWQEWQRFLDRNRVRTTVLYPSDLLTFGAVRGTRWAAALARAYNNYLYDHYARHSERIYGMALIPVQDGQEAAKELERAVKELGFVGGVLMVSGIRRPLGDRMYDPLYQQAQELDVPLAAHAGGSDYLGFDRFFDKGEVEILCVSHAFGQMVQLVSMMMAGVFERYPRLRVGYLEGGAGWFPWLLERMDAQFETRACVQAPDIKRPPSEYVRAGNIFVHMELEEATPEFLDLLRAKVGRDDIFMYASDLPHEPVHEIEEHLAEFRASAHVRADCKRALLAGAARRFYRFD